jgi:glucose/arabinose dehydrogenase
MAPPGRFFPAGEQAGIAPCAGKFRQRSREGSVPRVRVLALAAVLVISSLRSPAGGPIADPIPGAIAPGDVTVALDTFATGLVAPLWGTHAGDGSGRLFVADMFGVLWAFDTRTGAQRLFLDVRSLLVPFVFFEERGFVGLAFHPNYARNGLLYTFTGEPFVPPGDFTSTYPPGVLPDHQSVITEWRVPDPSDPQAVVDPGSRRVLMRIDQPQNNHNGGCIVFGPDGMLYITLGDGGAGEDEGPGHGVIGNGQDLTNVLGDILRIDVNGRDSANGRYGIPPDNPHVGKPGVDEIWASGFRNPFRASFDRETGDFLIGDVGQYDIEEVNLGLAGANYGWNVKEGSFFFISNGPLQGFITDMDPGVPPGLTDPIAQYDHDEGVAVIGGFVYRGKALPKLTGKYVFGELLTRLLYLDDGNVIREMKLEDAPPLDPFLLGFGEDEDGEIYMMTNATAGPRGLTGKVLKLVPPDTDGDGLRDNVDNCPWVTNPGQEDPEAWGRGARRTGSAPLPVRGRDRRRLRDEGGRQGDPRRARAGEGRRARGSRALRRGRGRRLHGQRRACHPAGAVAAGPGRDPAGVPARD